MPSLQKKQNRRSGNKPDPDSGQPSKRVELSKKPAVKAGETSPNAKRVLIVDDHPMIREGLRGTINAEGDLLVCGECADAREALERIKVQRPDLVLMDITLPGKSGLELLKDIRLAFPALPILVLSMHDESLYAERALRAGAGGYITKQQPPGTLIAAIHAVIQGRIHVSKEVNENILRRLSGRRSESISPLENLTDREFEVFQLIGGGKTTGQIAKLLHLSPKTIAVHYANIRRKLKLPTYADLIRFAVRQEEARNLTAPAA
jgi:DNA-binding NarL/FixJ family response regulator